MYQKPIGGQYVALREPAAAMHGTGKINNPDSVVALLRRLTAAEWAVLQADTGIRRLIVCEIDNRLIPFAAPSVCLNAGVGMARAISSDSPGGAEACPG